MQQNSLEDFSNILKNFRKEEDLTLDTLSKYLGVSDVYVSKLENGKRFPSKNILFWYVLFMDQSQMHDDIEKLLTIFSENKKISYEQLRTEYDEFVKKFREKQNKHSSKIQRKEIKLTMNEFNQYQIEEIDEPYFDLKWLLNQSEYKLFYSGIDNKNSLGFNEVLSESDKKMLSEIVNSVIQRIYNDENQK
ncbi:helix-turn-helix transcriptional regulator [Staphylococcus aureus]|uniref:helix-turn-helix domain-containing protein n=1 Tax=Staphylococcus aureus TaxID=1280 RepID=UPI0013A6E85E|nr:helix-turn-helix transcriptional regulator [Staphylococcus aureus]MCR0746534.1 helix-turn-helix domain-containing protein [Staphylococcus aureus]MDG6742795.1 helix-turn-helix transcriptional regulator [Staphylococcus aureus]MDG6750359.1 helix-turn-helix transcriptional regulator [Staphylococcus aureus]MDG6754469.1 helix-turn-helix transcriptional regulator [Staphylococcus aureus]MDG6759817.1 helix-turn-helix transcriptional regulator [Staphylococcus aureus]